MQDLLRVADSSGKLKSFEHPFVQSWMMFLGAFLCLFAFMFQLRLTKKRDQREKNDSTCRLKPC